MDTYLTTKEVAAKLRLHPETVLVLAQQKKIRSYRAGGGKRAARLYAEADVRAYLEQNTARTA